MTRRLLVVAGVSGSGKTTVAAALADRLDVPWLDADTLHPPANVERMRAGAPLDDAARWPWLDRCGDWLAEHEDGGVLACSALRRAYRDRLRARAPRASVVLLHADRAALEARVTARAHPFMPASLLESQLLALEPLEPDEPGLTVDAAQPVEAIVERCLGFSAAPAQPPASPPPPSL